MAIKLEPCPKCNSIKLQIGSLEGASSLVGYYVHCFNCGYYSRESAPTEEATVIKWNSEARTTPPTEQAFVSTERGACPRCGAYPQGDRTPPDKTLIKQLPIIGYRSLSEKEINLVNQIKTLGNEVGKLIDLLQITADVDPRWINIGKTKLQLGFMALNRAVANPESF